MNMSRPRVPRIPAEWQPFYSNKKRHFTFLEIDIPRQGRPCDECGEPIDVSGEEYTITPFTFEEGGVPATILFYTHRTVCPENLSRKVMIPIYRMNGLW